MSHTKQDISFYEKDIGIVITDSHGKITWVNAFMEKICGNKLEDIIGKKPKEFLQGEKTEKEAIQLMSERLAEKKEVINLTITNYNRKGETFYLRLNIYPRYDGDKFIGFISYQYNVTETMSALKDTESLNKQLLFENQKKKLLIRIISHDIKNLISTTDNISELVQNFIKQGDLDKSKEYLIKLRDNNKATYHYLISILENSATEKEELLTDSTPYSDIKEVVATSIKFQNSFAQCKNISIDNQIDETVIIPGSKENLQVIINNILNNSIKHSLPNGMIKITCQQKNGQVVIQIIDYGDGMSKDMQNKLNSGKVDDLKTFGIKNSIQLLSQVNGKLHFISQPYILAGTICEIIFELIKH